MYNCLGNCPLCRGVQCPLSEVLHIEVLRLFLRQKCAYIGKCPLCRGVLSEVLHIEVVNSKCRGSGLCLASAGKRPLLESCDPPRSSLVWSFTLTNINSDSR